ncbi:D-alanine-activating enzyme [Xenorhabdus vietnamensis]|uniref:D-alanine-activating enzyme n=1 Tax=Xenorhabdus vietnamensis TaxID=351656 RepID=A0A1Y2S8S2_9GAMM|nr:AMP-binding protein [Xenorhabdus vietnamensis]OTA14530.1 D-alanine-activating enzyme [Xenorhabdus vietnamensis]
MFSTMIQSIVDRFHATPEAIALVHQEDSISFATLGQRVQAVLTLLGQLRPTFCVIYGHKEIDTVASILACTFANVPFSVVDTANPYKRVLQVQAVQQSDCLLLGTSGYQQHCSASPNIHDITSLAGQPFTLHRSTERSATDPFYVLTTSGSSGMPKGVKISYDNYAHFHHWYGALLQANAPQGMHVNHACLSFDMGILDLVSSLAAHQAVCMLPHAFNAMPRQNLKLLTQCEQAHATSWFSTPSFLEMMCLDPKFNGQTLPELTLFFIGGEFVSPALIDSLATRFPRATLRHAYGPTETSCVTHAHPIRSVDLSTILSLGVPMGNNRIQIESSEGTPLASDEIGEVVIYGPQVGHGYVPQSHPRNIAFGQHQGERYYRTGDMGYLDRAGHLFLIGREDGQVKWRGNRIELCEIETVAARDPNVTHCAVLPIYENNTVTELILFAQLRDRSSEQQTAFTNHLRCHLPKYMVPSCCKFLSQIPINLHGKIDRRQLSTLWHEPTPSVL